MRWIVHRSLSIMMRILSINCQDIQQELFDLRNARLSQVIEVFIFIAQSLQYSYLNYLNNSKHLNMQIIHIYVKEVKHHYSATTYNKKHAQHKTYKGCTEMLAFTLWIHSMSFSREQKQCLLTNTGIRVHYNKTTYLSKLCP